MAPPRAHRADESELWGPDTGCGAVMGLRRRRGSRVDGGNDRDHDIDIEVPVMVVIPVVRAAFERPMPKQPLINLPNEPTQRDARGVLIHPLRMIAARAWFGAALGVTLVALPA